MLCCDPVVDCDLVVIVFCLVFVDVDPVLLIVDGQPRVLELVKTTEIIESSSQPGL